MASVYPMPEGILGFLTQMLTSNSHFDPHPVEDGRRCPVLNEEMELSRITIETILNKLGQNFHNENCWMLTCGLDKKTSCRYKHRPGLYPLIEPNSHEAAIIQAVISKQYEAEQNFKA